MAIKLSEPEFNAIVARDCGARIDGGGMLGLASDCTLPGECGHLRYQRTEWNGRVTALSAQFDLDEDLEVHLQAGRDILITFFLDGGILGATGDGRHALDFRVRRAMLRLPNVRDGFVVRIPAGRRNAFVQLRVQQDYFRDWLSDLRVALPARWKEQLRGGDGRVLHNAAWAPPIEQCLRQIGNARLPTRLFLPYLNAKALELLTLFTHELSERAAGGDPMPADRLARVEELLLARLDDPPTIPALAREVGWNATDLKRAFRQRYGRPVHAHLRAARLAHAERLLETTGMSIYSVARECGWVCQSRFGQAFKAGRGLTPTEFRAAARAA